MRSRSIAALIVFAAALSVQFRILRPWYLNWGATPAEIGKQWPGDSITPQAATVATRAITIHAPASAVWPWIVQLGQDRAGFYSYTTLEDLFGADIHNTSQIVPEYQQRERGDSLWLTPKDRFNGRGHLLVAELEPRRAMVLISFFDIDAYTQTAIAPGGAWSMILDPIDSQTTRLIVRTRGSGNSGVLQAAFNACIFDPAHFMMERKMMLGIRERAEGTLRAPVRDVIQVGLWGAAFAMFILSMIWVFRGSNWERPLSSGILAFAVLHLLAYEQPDVTLGFVLIGATLVVMLWAYRACATGGSLRWRTH